jgi:hypothetical protein
MNLATGTAFRLGDSWRVGGGLDLRMPSGSELDLSANVWRLQEIGALAWDATKNLTLSPSSNTTNPLPKNPARHRSIIWKCSSRRRSVCHSAGRRPRDTKQGRFPERQHLDAFGETGDRQGAGARASELLALDQKAFDGGERSLRSMSSDLVCPVEGTVPREASDSDGAAISAERCCRRGSTRGAEREVVVVR